VVRSQSAIEYKAAFDAYVRAGETDGLRAPESKAISVGSNPEGGYVLPPDIETQIGERLTAIDPLYRRQRLQEAVHGGRAGGRQPSSSAAACRTSTPSR
jgi:HK97 family phage major capsid protein